MSKTSLKKFLPLFAGVGIVAASASTVVSCTAPIYAAGIDGQRIVVVTDGGHITDHSFNQDAYVGVNNFVNNAYEEMTEEKDENGNPVKDENGNIQYKPTGKRLSGKNDYIEAGGTDTTSIVSAYSLAVIKKANAIVAPGFAHLNPLSQSLPFLQKHNINVILVDSYLEAPNVTSIQFDSQISGVMAGFDTSYLFGTTYQDGKLKYDVNHDDKIKIGTFAGSSNKYGVDNYMWGLLLGMDLYNKEAEKHNKLGTDKWAMVESANNDGNIKDVKTTNNQDSDWYTNSFALGDATKSGIITKLVDTNKADVIFPVAGPQIQDVLDYVPQDPKSDVPYVIGVDVDQAAEYKDEKNKAGENRFITSAIKNIDTAVPEALYRASYDNGTGNTLKDFNTQENDKKYGSFTNGTTEGDHWLGKQFGNQLDPFVNWSIDFAKEGPLGGKYQLPEHYISLYDDSNLMKPADKGGVMWAINKYFRSEELGGKDGLSTDYMDGKKIRFITNLIEKHIGDKAIQKEGDVFDLKGITGISEDELHYDPAKVGD